VNRPDMTPNLVIYTIGHSNQNIESFLKLLRDNGIQFLVDIRSVPRSKYANQFDSAVLKKAVIKGGMKYLYFGREIGGKPNDPSFYDSEGYVLYNLIAQSPEFIKTIDRLVEGIGKYKIAIMCSEEDPTECHRRLLIGRVLIRYGIHELHIRADGQVQTEEELKSEQASGQNSMQLALFGMKKEELWRSAKPIRLDSPSEAQKDSSKP
jgi:uncharacterized protein (DUF488 family)